MKQYHGHGHQLRITHEWVAEQLQALGYNAEGLTVLTGKKNKHDVMLDGRRILVYDYNRGTVELDNGLKYSRPTGTVTGPGFQVETPAELADIVEIALKN